MCRALVRLVTIAVSIIPLAAQVGDSPTADHPGIHRQLLVDQQTVQAVRVTYEAGVAEPPGPHAYDVILVLLGAGTVQLHIAGQPDPSWRPGEAIFIKHGTDHRLVNTGKTPIQFITIRIPQPAASKE